MLSIKLSELVRSLQTDQENKVDLYKRIENSLKDEDLTYKDQKRLVQCFKEDLKGGDENDKREVLQRWVSCAKNAKTLSSELVTELCGDSAWPEALVYELFSRLIADRSLNLEEYFKEQNGEILCNKVIDTLARASASVSLKPLLNFIHIDTIRSIFQTKSNCARVLLCALVLRLTPEYGLQLCEKEIQCHAIDNFKNVYMLVIEDLRKADNKIWYHQCMFTLMYFGKLMHNQIELMNNLLSNIEHGFKCRTMDDKILSFDCWKVLIDISSLDHSYLCGRKQLKLLVKPLKVKLSRNEQVASKRLEVWLHLLSALQENCLACLEEFMNFCSEPETPLIKCTWSKRTEALMDIIGHYGSGECCVSPRTLLLKSAVINSANILKYKNLLLNAIRVCSENMLDWEIKSSRQKKIMCLWGSLFRIVGKLHELDRELMLRDIFAILKIFLKKSEKDGYQDYFDDILQPIFDVISMLEDQSCDYLVFNEIIVFPIAQLMLSCSNVSEYRALAFIQLLRSCSKTGSRLDYFNRSCELLKSYTHDKTQILSSYIWLELANELLSICRSPKDEFDVFKTSSKFLMCWICECEIPDNLKEMVIDKWCSIMTEIDVICEEFKKSVLEHFQKLLKENPTAAFNILEFLPIIIDKIGEKTPINYVSNVVDIVSDCLKNPCLKSSKVISVLPIISKVSGTISKSDITESEALGLKLFECLEYFLKPQQVYETLTIFKSILPQLSQSLKKRLPATLRALINDLITQPDSIIAQDATSVVVELEKQDVVKIPIFVKPVVSTRTAKIARMTAGDVSKDQSLNLFAQAVQKSPIIIKGSMISNVHQRNSRIMKIANAMPNLKKHDNLELDANSSDFVYIDSEVKVDYNKMVSHQKEVLRKRKEDIPALYQDLSRSQHSSESFSKSNESLDFKSETHDLNFKNILDDIKKNGCSSLDNYLKDISLTTTKDLSEDNKPQRKSNRLSLKSEKITPSRQSDKPAAKGSPKIIILQNEILPNFKDTKELQKSDKKRRFSDSQSLSQNKMHSLAKRSSSLESLDNFRNCNKSFKIVPIDADGENTHLKLKISITNEKNIKNNCIENCAGNEEKVEEGSNAVIVERQINNDMNEEEQHPFDDKIKESNIEMKQNNTEIKQGNVENDYRNQNTFKNNEKQLALILKKVEDSIEKSIEEQIDLIREKLSPSSKSSTLNENSSNKRKRKPRKITLNLAKSRRTNRRTKADKGKVVKENKEDKEPDVSKHSELEQLNNLGKSNNIKKQKSTEKEQIIEIVNKVTDSQQNLKREENIDKKISNRKSIAAKKVNKKVINKMTDNPQNPKKEKTVHKEKISDRKDIADKTINLQSQRNVDKVKNNKKKNNGNMQEIIEKQNKIDEEIMSNVNLNTRNEVNEEQKVFMISKINEDKHGMEVLEEVSLVVSLERMETVFKNEDGVLFIKDKDKIADEGAKEDSSDTHSNNAKSTFIRQTKQMPSVVENFQKQIGSNIEKRDRPNTRKVKNESATKTTLSCETSDTKSSSEENQERKMSEVNKENTNNRQNHVKQGDNKLEAVWKSGIMELSHESAQSKSENIFDTQGLIKMTTGTSNLSSQDVTICDIDLMRTHTKNDCDSKIGTSEKKGRRRSKLSPESLVKKEISKLKMDIVGADNFIGISQKRLTSLRLSSIFEPFSNNKRKRRSDVGRQDNSKKPRIVKNIEEKEHVEVTKSHVTEAVKDKLEVFNSQPDKNLNETKEELSQCLVTAMHKKTAGDQNKNEIHMSYEIISKNLSGNVNLISELGTKIKFEKETKEVDTKPDKLAAKATTVRDKFYALPITTEAVEKTNLDSIIALESQDLLNDKSIISKEENKKVDNTMSTKKTNVQLSTFVSVKEINDELDQLSYDLFSPSCKESKGDSFTNILTSPKSEKSKETTPDRFPNNKSIIMKQNLELKLSSPRKRTSNIIRKEESKANLEENSQIDTKEVVRRSKRFQVMKNVGINDKLGSEIIGTVISQSKNESLTNDDDIIESSQSPDIGMLQLNKSALKRKKGDDTTQNVNHEELSKISGKNDFSINHQTDYFSTEIVPHKVNDTLTCNPERSNLGIQQMSPESELKILPISSDKANDTLTCNPEASIVSIQHVSPEHELKKSPSTNLLMGIDLSDLPTGLNMTDQRNLPGSPIPEDMTDRSSELLNSTLNISPIKNDQMQDQSNQGEKLDTPINFIKSPSSRSMMLMNLLPQNAKITKSPKSVVRKTQSNTVGSPSTDRVRRMMMKCNGNTTPENMIVKDEQMDEVDVLEFRKEVPSPFATPNRSILKRKAYEVLDCGISPCPKRKRVNFSDPPITAEKIYFKEGEEDSADIFCTPSELNQRKATPIYPPLTNCLTDIREVLMNFSQGNIYDNFSSLNIKTVGDLAKLTSTQVNQMDFLNNPRLSSVTTALATFAESYCEKEKIDKPENSLVPNDDANIPINGDTKKNALLVSAMDKLKKSDEGVSELWQELKAICTQQHLRFIFEDLKELFTMK